MVRKLTAIALVLVFALVLAVPAYADPGAPNFEASIWADGRLFSSKATALLPAPTANNVQSYDKLFVITNSNNPDGQFAVAEAAPGNPAFNGGRWFTHTVMWNQAGFDHYGTVPVLTSYADIMANAQYLDITPGSPAGGPPDYFQCPLLPVK